MNIGLFQLENLLHSQVRFCFLDVRENQQQVPSELAKVLAGALKIGVDSVEKFLRDSGITLESPVILLSEDGARAGALRTRLEALGYRNIYVVEGGLEGLLSEL